VVAETLLLPGLPMLHRASSNGSGSRRSSLSCRSNQSNQSSRRSSVAMGVDRSTGSSRSPTPDCSPQSSKEGIPRTSHLTSWCDTRMQWQDLITSGAATPEDELLEETHRLSPAELDKSFEDIFSAELADSPKPLSTWDEVWRAQAGRLADAFCVGGGEGGGSLEHPLQAVMQTDECSTRPDLIATISLGRESINCTTSRVLQKIQAVRTLTALLGDVEDAH